MPVNASLPEPCDVLLDTMESFVAHCNWGSSLGHPATRQQSKLVEDRDVGRCIIFLSLA